MGFYRVLNRCKAAVAGKKQTLPRTKSYGKLGAHGVYDGFLVNVVALPAVNPFGIVDIISGSTNATTGIS